MKNTVTMCPSPPIPLPRPPGTLIPQPKPGIENPLDPAGLVRENWQMAQESTIAAPVSSGWSRQQRCAQCSSNQTVPSVLVSEL